VLLQKPHVVCSALKRDGANRSEPLADLGGIGLIHVEEVRHYRLQDRLAGVIRRHRYGAAENLERPAVPVFADVVKGGEPGVDESAQVLTDRLPAFPIGYAQVARGMLDEAVKTFAERFVIDFLPESQKPFRSVFFCEGQRVHCIPVFLMDRVMSPTGGGLPNMVLAHFDKLLQYRSRSVTVAFGYRPPLHQTEESYVKTCRGRLEPKFAFVQTGAKARIYPGQSPACCRIPVFPARPTASIKRVKRTACLKSGTVQVETRISRLSCA
jgi:hypothetical protein